jgi:hypothetical protein
MRGDLSGGQVLGAQRDHHAVDALQTALPLAHGGRLEAAVPVAGHRDLHGPTSVSTILEREPLRELPPSRPSEAWRS